MKISNRPKVIVIVGPTSSGKTELSLQLAKKFNGVIISADSRQIYRHMDIATAKTTKDQQQGIVHYMIDIADPDQEFTLALYQQSVKNLLETIFADNRKRNRPIIPFIVGGTGLYIKAIVDGYKLPAVPPNLALRDKLETLSLDKLVAKLHNLDPQSKVDLHNKRRVIRAIEILITHRKMAPETNPPEYEFLQIGIDRPRETLYQRIGQKISEMYKDGLVKETKKLLALGYNFASPSFSAHGYKHIKQYLDHKITLKRALELMAIDTRHYAKRQLTWFRRDPRIHWTDNYQGAEELIIAFLK